MKFTYDGEMFWVSECGNYRIWVQARPRESGTYWGAKFRDEPWLTDTATKAEAKALCIEHRDKRNT